MASQRVGRPRKASTAASHPPVPGIGGTPTVETSAASTGGGGISNMPPPSFSGTGPTTAADCESLANQLVDPSLAIRRKLDIAGELRDSAESNKDFAFYEKYLAILMPALMTVLGDEKTITFSKEGPDQVSASCRCYSRRADSSVYATPCCRIFNDCRIPNHSERTRPRSWSS